MTDLLKTAILVAFMARFAAHSLGAEATVAWSFVSPAEIYLNEGEATALAAIPHIPLGFFEPKDWQAETEIRVGKETMRLWFGSDTSTWRSDAAATGFVSVLQRETRTIVGRGIQEMDHPDRFDFFPPEDGSRSANGTPSFQIKVLSWPKAQGEWFDIEFIEAGGVATRGRAKWLRQAGLWTHCRAQGGMPENCEWAWYLNGAPLSLDRDRRGLNNAGILVLPGFKPERDAGIYEVVFRFRSASGHSSEIRARFDVKSRGSRQ